jgi:hypothetical protein
MTDLQLRRASLGSSNFNAQEWGLPTVLRMLELLLTDHQNAWTYINPIVT